ncbi:thioredoxin family protein [Odoribacter sp. OttesenSCG-928-L07]|nr:thioredoxin family protein [Odoribacter sp. OttesenSCG-928-L07]MDL2239747.1 thioredoxin family protein [Bacteroidales bacterium OttesenSCG-928-L14]MDL2241076.1 thioredoxin family protein [Bacteroidales bacterium OttesenSCG-928-K22]
MEIIVLGTGCVKCKTTYETVKKVIEENGLDINLTKQEDIMEIMKYNVMTLPAIVVDGTVKIKGHVPSKTEIRKLLNVE